MWELLPWEYHLLHIRLVKTMILCQRQGQTLHLSRWDNGENLKKNKAEGTDPTATIVYHRWLGRVQDFERVINARREGYCCMFDMPGNGMQLFLLKYFLFYSWYGGQRRYKTQQKAETGH